MCQKRHFICSRNNYLWCAKKGISYVPTLSITYVPKLSFWCNVSRFTWPTPTWSFTAFSRFSSLSLWTARFTSGKTLSSFNLENIKNFQIIPNFCLHCSQRLFFLEYFGSNRILWRAFDCSGDGNLCKL